MFFFMRSKIESECLKFLTRLVSSLIAYLSLKFIFETQVTGVGVNTEWGLLMASVSEDNGGETPLQVSKFICSYFFLSFCCAIFICTLFSSGTIEWCCYIYRDCGTYSCWRCTICPCRPVRSNFFLTSKYRTE